MLIAETEYRYQVEEDIKPFRDVLLGLFFVTVGMALNLTVVAQHILWVVALLVVPVVAKLALVVVLSRAFGATLGTSLRNGFYLAQAGEFALVLLGTRRGAADHFADDHAGRAGALVLSMLSAPLLIQYSEKIVRRLTPTTGWHALRRSRRSPRRRWRGSSTSSSAGSAERPEPRAPSRGRGDRLRGAGRRSRARPRRRGDGTSGRCTATHRARRRSLPQVS
jgi:hypothetical protein